MAKATLLDLDNTNETELEPNESHQEIAQEQPDPFDQQDIQEPQEDDDDIPEKYKGKTLKDLVRMHAEAEKLVGRQSSEVGELRKVVDEFIRTQTQAKDQAPEEDDDDFFVDPKKALNKAIENHPKLKEAEQVTLQYKRATALSELQRKHPDMPEIVGNEKFIEWVTASRIRQQLFQQADQAYDYEAADELFTLWKERNQAVQQTAKIEEQERKRQLKSANTGSGRGSSEGVSKKIYRRADIIKLMKTDPDRYAQLSDEIMRAYSEGRVKWSKGD